MKHQQIFPITLSWAALLLVLFFAALTQHWFGPPQGVGGSFCEVGDGGLIIQPANTWSNLGFIFSGLLIAFQLGQASFTKNNNPIGRIPFYGLFFSMLAVFLGPGSMAMHATTTKVGGFLDMLSMYLIASFMVSYAAIRLFARGPAFFSLVFAVILSICIWANFQRQPITFFHFAGNFAFAVFVSLGVLFEFINSRLHPAKHNLKWGVAGVTAILTALFIWSKTATGGPWCNPDSLVQGHAIWHLLDAFSVYCLFRFYISEDLQPAAQ